MKVMPHLSTAAVTGAIAMPLHSFGQNWIIAAFREDEVSRVALQLIWGIAAFTLPVLLGTGMLAQYNRNGEARPKWYQMSFSREDIHRHHIPVWKRMGVFFVSAVISHLVFQAVGVEF